jgi:SAM-dependent methyltransferase
MASNDSNKIFYNTVPLNVFQSLTAQGGFDHCVDLKLIADQISPSVRVLEVGAGYGRCIDFLIEKKHEAAIVGVEQSPQLFNVLVEKYKNNPVVTIINQDIKTMEVSFQVDVVLWLFSGLLDFSKEEQVVVLKKLRLFLKEGGKLFLDIPQLAELTVAKYTGTQDIVMETPYGNISTYLPSFSDLERYSSEAGFSDVSVNHYETETAKKRSMYQLTN